VTLGNYIEMSSWPRVGLTCGCAPANQNTATTALCTAAFKFFDRFIGQSNQGVIVEAANHTMKVWTIMKKSSEENNKDISPEEFGHSESFQLLNSVATK
jgi:hypothetical protein